MSESENIDLSNNLSVAEAAFEQFQSVAAYEEDEFIKLSDIVDPPQPTLDINACLDKIQDDAGIISEIDPQADENIGSETTVETSYELIVPLPTSCDKESNSTQRNERTVHDIPKDIPQPTPKKRGKRKKKSITSVDLKQPINTSGESVTGDTDKHALSEEGTEDGSNISVSHSAASDRLSQYPSSEFVTPTKNTSKRRKRQLDKDILVKSQPNIATEETVKLRKRGRPKKVNTTIIHQDQTQTSRDACNILENPSSQVDKSHTETFTEGNKINDNSHEGFSNMDQNNITSNADTKQCTVKKTSSRYGRTKKSTINNDDLNHLESNEITNTPSESSLKENSSVRSSNLEKRKSKSKKKVEEKKYDEIELELLRMLSTPTDELEQKLNQTENKTETEKNEQKPKRKRGRKQKKQAEEQAIYSENSFDNEPKQIVVDEGVDDETDDICLSSLKKRIRPEDEHQEENSSIGTEKVPAIDSINETSDNVTDIVSKCNTKKPTMSDFECNIDTVVNEPINDNVEQEVTNINSPETESPSKRPKRKKAKIVLHYDEGSDEDPFANVELSDDDGTLSGRKGGKYYSDDEYIPGKNKKGKAYSDSESSFSESDEIERQEDTKVGKKKGRKSFGFHKNKKSKKHDLSQNAIADVTSTTADTTTQNDDDLDHSLQSPDITTNVNSSQNPSQAWGMSHEFENFIAQKIQGTNLKIKKLTGTTSNESAITPLEIPVLDPNEPKKTVEMSTQTHKISTTSTEVQTTSPHESIMKAKVPLTAEQSEKACEFLKGIVKNTSELGQLMIQKSEDFIQKKINTKNVTDTTKMDYCVQKSFLLFKLAKHNLIQMEEDLANEYEQFLQSHNMSQYRESPKCITASSKQTNSDSDCEIVEDVIPKEVKEKEKSKFSLKTVFLNKELSIKIAKKSSEEKQAKKEKVGVKSGRHTVWINDSIMVKKVKPTQSFLAQDSRNKKPPDNYISIDMIRKFFDSYYKRQKVLSTCAPFVSPEWLNVKQVAVCNYFIAQSDNLSTHSRILLTPQDASEPNIDGMSMGLKENYMTQPKSLLAQCTKVLQKYMYDNRNNCKESIVAENNHHSSLENEYQPKTLFRLSFIAVTNMMLTEENKTQKKVIKSHSIRSLKNLCLRSINIYIHNPRIIQRLSNTEGLSTSIKDNHKTQNNRIRSLSHLIENTHIKSNVKSLFSCCVESIQKTNAPLEKCDNFYISNDNITFNTISNASELITSNQIKSNVKSLFTSCIESIQNKYFPLKKYDYLNVNEKSINFNKIKTLKCIAFENVKYYLYNDYLNVDDNSEVLEETLPSTHYYTANTHCMNKSDQMLALTIKSVNTLSDDTFAKLPDTIEEEPSYSDDNNSNFLTYNDFGSDYGESNDNLTDESNWVSRVQLQEFKSCFTPIDSNSKSPVTKDSNNECVVASIKIEPFEEASENVDPTIIKTEMVENDEMLFNPLATKLENCDNEPEEVFPERSSSSYDIDAFEEFARSSKMLRMAADYNLANDEVFSQSALRVHKQHEPDMDDEFDTSMSLLIPQQNTDVAKDRLMKSSSDEETNTQKNSVKKKRKIRPKISRLKNKDVNTTKNKNAPDETEVALLTRKMQERIRREEKSDDSSDSEQENSLAKLKHDKSKKEEKTKQNADKEVDNVIQCNDVDSTEHLNDKSINPDENKEVNPIKPSKMSLRKKNKLNNLKDNHDSTEPDNPFVIQPDEPVELLECEPTLPMMHDENMENMETETESGHIDQKSHEPELHEEPSYIDRHGWKCYPVQDNDTKLYEHTYILLEKLPESFVEMYFRYQGVADVDPEDTDINRLTNLQSLHRSFSKDNKARSKTNKMLANSQPKSVNTENSRASSPTNDDHFTELAPSDDEGANIDDEIAPALPLNSSENVMAKNSLMNDMESDSEKPDIPEAEVSMNKSIKKEEDNDDEPISKMCRPGPKSKKKLMKENDSTLLTADKMMNKELALLHAPVTLDSQDVKVNDASKKPSLKNHTRSSPRLRAHPERDKPQDESSSEEEKQWVTTKEKLLKRLVKKQGDPSVDDAKRAKIVSEFIEKRGDEKRPIRLSGRKGRSRKKFLERKKQMSVLNRELFGEPDTSYAGRKTYQIFGKGRRNIRKVIDKKSLARSTVIANMEEFERKRRLNMQQTRLREELGCEEGVNVLVINDEVCLEYDFEQMCPVVTIHPFFTKVMKAHQYEGVKFMWDACFESLAMVGAGHPGGGCILAHCMGLGKTLQVLALLHTVLTHPGVGMKRVLVCCPLSTVLNWVDEINKWIGPVTNQIKVFELSKLKKTYERAYQLEDWYKDGGIFIIGYELFRSLTTLDPVLDDIRPKIVDKIRHALLNPGPDVVICDEGHLLKNDASVLAVAMSRVATRRRIVLTGTPMQNNLREYYCMVNFVKPSLLGTYSEYSNRFENPIMNGQHRDSQEADIKLMKARTHILHKVLEGCLQRQEASVLYPYLPKKHEYTVFIPPTKCQWDLYKHYIMTYALEQENKQQQNQQKKQSLLKDFHVLQKIWTHPQVLHNFLMKARDERNKIKEEKLEDDLAQEDLAASEDVKPNQTEVWWLQYLAGGDMLESLDSSNKFMVVFQLLEECIALGDKVLIFSTSLYTMDALEYFLKRINKWSLGHDYFRLDGSVPAEVRQKWCREFNAPNNVNTKLFLISTRAGCLGLNMTAANRVIILDTSWNPAHDIQSIFRVYRFGQKKDCYIYRLVAMGTMEQKIYERSVTKQAVSCRVVDEQQIDRHYNMAELTELYRYDEEGTSVEAGLAAGVSDVALLRVAARARLHAVREHDSLLRGSREQHLPEHERNAAWMQFQQEHANNEMQDRLLEASQGIQKILEAKCADPSGSMPLKTEIEEQPQEIVPQPAPKGRKAKKKEATPTPPVEDTKISEQKEKQFDLDNEEAKVKKIMQLLIKHNFHSSQRAHQISQLVADVRSIVDAGGAGLEQCDDLTRSIATVMLQEGVTPITSSDPPPLTDIITGEVVTSPSRSDVKQEVSYEVPVETLEEVPEEITDKTPYQNTLNDGDEVSLLVPMMERRRRGRPRKYFADEIFEPVVKRQRGRPRKNTTDTEHSSVDDDLSTPLHLRTIQGRIASIASKRLMDRPRPSYASDLESSVPDHSSKEQSPEMDDIPLLMRARRLKRNKRTHAVPESDVTIIDDEDSRGKTSEPVAVPAVIQEAVDLEVNKPRRAIAVKSTAKAQLSGKNYNGKMKRKAALVAEQHLETLGTEDIVTLDDDDEWVDDSDKTGGPKNSTTPPRGVDQNNGKSKTKRNIETKSTKQGDSSILLSDDEDRAKTNVNVLSSGPTTSTESEVPLHPSMLSNPNFIKIVAYAYQSNRMLDEDAALLAARYSTQKALKEYETTGKDITSGPLYDIAVKVLTKDVLKKLHTKKGAKVKNEASIMAMNNIDSNRKQDTSRTDPGQAVTLTGERNPPHNYEMMSSDYTSQPNVVPIGMFRGSGVNQKTHEVVEESILPDDDDCILGTTDEPLPTDQSIFKKRNSQQFIVTSVKATAQRESQPVSAVETIVPEIENSHMVPASQSHSNVSQPTPRVEPYVTITERPQFILGANSSERPTFRLSKSNLSIEPITPQLERSKLTSSQPQLTLTISEGKLVQPQVNVRQSSNDTICLDSDEEDSSAVSSGNITNASTHTSAPTPVAVTTSKSSFSGLSNVQAMRMRTNNAQPQETPVTTAHAKQHGKIQLTKIYPKLPDTVNQQKTVASSKTSGPLPKLPKILPKPTESSNRDAPQTITKKVINPEDLMSKANVTKTCKPGDIVRITKKGNMSVLSKVDKLPENLKKQLINVPVSSEETKSQQAVIDKSKPSSSSTSGRATSPGNDPLSILKDVIHIQADEYDQPKLQPEKANKLNHTNASKSMETLGKIKLLYPSKMIAEKSSKTSVPSKTTVDTMLKIRKKEITKVEPSKSAMIDLTHFVGNNKTVAVVHKSKDKASPKGSVVVGSSKDIIIRSKPVGSTLTKASTSAANTSAVNTNIKTATIKKEFESKKRASPWPESNPPKSKKDKFFRPTLTLEDFDIDDIDDIIELE